MRSLPGCVMTGLRYLTIILLLSLQAGCTSTTRPAVAGDKVLGDLYCDSYFIYKMCAKDLDSSGEVDVIYFQDTSEVFMVNPVVDESVLASMPMHECVQVMDDEILAASSALLTINESTGILTKTRIKSRLILSYASIMADVNKCHKPAADLAMPAADDFGDEDYEDLSL